MTMRIPHRAAPVPSLLLSLAAVLLMAFSCRESSREPVERSLAGTAWEAESEPGGDPFVLLLVDETRFRLGTDGVYFEGEYTYREPTLVLRYPAPGQEEGARAVTDRLPRAVLTMTPDGLLRGYPYADAPAKPRSYTFRRIQ